MPRLRTTVGLDDGTSGPDGGLTAWPNGTREPMSMNQLAEAAGTHPGGRPWRLWPVDNGVEIRAERWRGAQPPKIGACTVRVTAGAALANLRLGIAVLGHPPVVNLLPDARRASMLAVVRRGGRRDPSTAERRLFAAIRPVGRFLPPVGGFPVAPGLVRRARAAVEAEGMWLRSVDDVARERLMFTTPISRPCRRTRCSWRSAATTTSR